MEQKTRKILVVDDEDSIISLMTAILSANGYEVIPASNGKEGLDQYKKEQPDLVITDIVMPDMEGIELIRYLRKLDKDLPVIVMSGNPTGKQFLKTAALLGAKSTLNKPFATDELLNLVSDIINN